MQLRTVNKAIQSTGFELVKGDGYFYFVGDGAERLYSASVYVPRLNDLSLDGWIAEATGKRTEIDAMDEVEPVAAIFKLRGRANH